MKRYFVQAKENEEARLLRRRSFSQAVAFELALLTHLTILLIKGIPILGAS
jgi:hypothetical protein